MIDAHAQNPVLKEKIAFHYIPEKGKTKIKCFLEITDSTKKIIKILYLPMYGDIFNQTQTLIFKLENLKNLA